ncbi:MAG: ATP-dependent metallopeptidase FtsH/Yme1/Tma family protein, partial [Gammaproteobacteria bacterium]
MNDLAKNIILWIVIAIVLLSVFNNFATGPRVATTIEYSQFLDYVDSSSIDNVRFDGREISGNLKSGGDFKTFSPETDNTAVIGQLQKSGVTFSGTEVKSQSLFVSLLINAFPVLLLIGVWIYFMRQMQGGGGGRGALSFGKSRARLLGEDQV